VLFRSSLGEALDGELGIAKRSFGPGTARPVIRSFDGDRVLVLQDGNRVGGLGFESGDHAEPVDVLTAERVEVVKGPATLLYGSNAIGGVVNTITGHDSPHKGVNGYLTALGSTNSNQAGGSGGFEYGGERWLTWANVGGQRSGDYDTPLGRVENSFSREISTAAGFGFYPKKGFFSFNYNFNKRRYGIPVDPAEEDPEIVELNPRRHSIEFRGGFRETGTFIEVNSQPDRLDLRDVHARAAAEAGVRLVVSTDSHELGALDYLQFGVAQARRAWVTKEHVVNTRTWNQVQKLMKR
jgi:iron complex outermembrane receptor protein